jgi:hypothetical protein
MLARASFDERLALKPCPQKSSAQCTFVRPESCAGARGEGAEWHYSLSLWHEQITIGESGTNPLGNPAGPVLAGARRAKTRAHPMRACSQEMVSPGRCALISPASDRVLIDGFPKAPPAPKPPMLGSHAIAGAPSLCRGSTWVPCGPVRKRAASRIASCAGVPARTCRHCSTEMPRWPHAAVPCARARALCGAAAMQGYRSTLR